MLPHLPEKEASPNYTKGHFYGLNKVRQIQHDEVILLVRNEGVPDTPWPKAHLHIKWRASDKRRRDPDNLLGAMKGHIDGLHYSGLQVSSTHLSLFSSPRSQYLMQGIA